MNRNRFSSVSWLHLILAIGLILGLGPMSPTLAAPAQPQAISADSYGYSIGAGTYDWVEINTETEVVFLNTISDFAGPINLGFNFDYYENTYSQLYITNSGVLLFGYGINLFYRAPMPFTAKPNNAVAAFWSPLYQNNGKVFYKSDTTSVPKRFIIQWQGMGNSIDATTYQAILYDNGNMLFQYKELPNEALEYTIGVEDMDGIVGVRYPNAVSEGQALLVTRPASSVRVKTTPQMQGGFISQGKVLLPVQVKNTSELSSDRYDITFTTSTPGWQTSVMLEVGNTALTDTNSNGVPDTGAMAPGTQKNLMVDIRPPLAADEGAATTVIMKATSASNPSVWMTSTLSVGIPAQFAQMYVNTSGIHLGQIWEVNFIDYPVTDIFTGSSMSMEAISLNDYLIGWERLVFQGARRFTDVYYRIVNRFIGAGSDLVLTNGQEMLAAEPDITEANARNPSIAVNNQTGITVMAWNLYKWKPSSALRERLPSMRPEDTQVMSTNIYLNFLDATTKNKILAQAYKVTNDNSWYGTAESHNRINTSVAVTNDGRYYVCWVDQVYSEAGTSSTTIYCSIYTLNGTTVAPVAGPIPVAVTTGNEKIVEMSLNTLGTNNVLISYRRSDGISSQVYYMIWNSAGTKILDQTPIPASDGSQPRAIVFGTLANADAMIAWIDPNNQISYAYLNPSSSYAMRPGFPRSLPAVDGRMLDSLSITLETNGRAVLSWLDTDDYERLYYALLDPAQNVITPPVIFIKGNGEVLQTSDYGFGNASYQGVYQLFLPITRRP